MPYGKPVSSTRGDDDRSAGAVRTDESDHSGFVVRVKNWRESIRRRPAADLVYRTVVTVVGFLIIGLGILLLPLPGPGWLIVFLGLGILATEYEWSRRLLAYARAKVSAWTEWLGRQSIAVRALAGLLVLAFAAAVISVVLWWYGVPTWIPDWVPLVHDLPQR